MKSVTWTVSFSVLTIVILVVLRTILLVINVIGPSMGEGLRNGSVILVLTFWPRCFLRKGNIVVSDISKVPQTPFFGKKSHLVVKRLRGLPGNIVTVPLSKLHPKKQEVYRHLCDPAGDLIWLVPPGHYFLKGDGLIGSDSVDWGPIPSSTFVGVMLLRLHTNGNLIAKRNCTDNER